MADGENLNKCRWMEGRVFFELAKYEIFAAENGGAVNLFPDLLNTGEWPSMRPVTFLFKKLPKLN
jgi:hypothetical protein